MKGRKRHTVVEVLGLVLNCHVGAANQVDVKAAPFVLLEVLEQYERIRKILADKGYRGGLGDDLEAVYGVLIEISQQTSKGFTVEAKR